MLRFIILIDTALNLVLALSFAVMEPQTFPPPHLPPYIATLILISLSRLESFTSTSRASSQSPSLSSQSSALRLAYGGICWVVMSFIKGFAFCGVNVVSVSGRLV
jgi:hypothetical protein